MNPPNEADAWSFEAVLAAMISGDEAKGDDPVEQVRADRALVADEVEAAAAYRQIKAELRRGTLVCWGLPVRLAAPKNEIELGPLQPIPSAEWQHLRIMRQEGQLKAFGRPGRRYRQLTFSREQVLAMVSKSTIVLSAAKPLPPLQAELLAMADAIFADKPPPARVNVRNKAIRAAYAARGEPGPDDKTINRAFEARQTSRKSP